MSIVIASLPALATAEPADDGYCDYIEGSAAAEAAPLYAPQLFTQFGFIEQPTFAETPTTDPSNLRVLGGIRYSLTNIYAAAATNSRARATCRRYKAMVTLRGVTVARGVGARLRVLEGAQAEADRILREVMVELQARRATTPEAIAMRLRVEELRSLAAAARRELAALPPVEAGPVENQLAAFRSADAAVETNEAKLRTIRAYDFSVRFGLDRFLDGPNTSTNYFAVAQLGINLSALWVGGHNDRAAAGRKRYARSGRDSPGSDASVEQLRAMIDTETTRISQLQALVTDLGQQLDMLAKVGTDDTRRYRNTVWFDWIKAKAELAYVQAHVEALREALGGHVPAR